MTRRFYIPRTTPPMHHCDRRYRPRSALGKVFSLNTKQANLGRVKLITYTCLRKYIKFKQTYLKIHHACRVFLLSHVHIQSVPSESSPGMLGALLQYCYKTRGPQTFKKGPAQSLMHPVTPSSSVRGLPSPLRPGRPCT
jgi:hypothetical protein